MKRSENEDKDRQFSERYYGRFGRRIPLGVEVDGIRANAVAPGPIWTPLIPSTMTDEAVPTSEQVPMKRPGQPAGVATAYVMLADPLSSYVSGTTIAVTGGKPFI